MSSKPLVRKAELRAKASKRALQIFGAGFTVIGAVIYYFLVLQPLWQTFQARSWERVPAVVEHSEVEVNPDSDGDTYRVLVKYRYRFAGRNYTSDCYQFSGVFSSGYSSKQRVVQQYQKGREIEVFVNPRVPEEAVIQLGLSDDFWWLALILLIFPGVGAGFLYAGTKSLSGSQQQAGALRQDAAALHTDLFLLGKYMPTITPKVKFVGMLLVALFWNGIVSVFVYQLIASWREGTLDFLLAVFLLPFLAVGLGLLGGVVYFFLGLFNPTTSIFFDDASPRLGGRLALRWELHGQISRLQRLEITLEGQEKATYRRGTSTITETHTFMRITLFTGDVRTANLAIGSAAARIPADTMHSFDGGSNSIMWTVHVRGEIPRWPDVHDEYQIYVQPLALRQ